MARIVDLGDFSRFLDIARNIQTWPDISRTRYIFVNYWHEIICFSQLFFYLHSVVKLLVILLSQICFLSGHGGKGISAK